MNWKRTLQQNPIVSNGNVIFNNIIVETKSNSENILIDIYKYSLKRSIDVIGFLFNLKSNFLEVKPFNKIIKSKYLTVLHDEISMTFDDNRKTKLNHLVNIIIGLDCNNDKKEICYGVDTYHNIYEHMINNIFSNIDDIKDFYPKATWDLIGRNKFDSSKLRPDTILLKDNIGYVLDAKYYRFGTTGDITHLPDVSSISKQIIYAEYLKQLNQSRNLQLCKIYNSFILPYNKNDNSFNTNQILSYIGNSKSEWKDNTETFHYIYTFLIDLKHVVNSYNNLNNDVDVDRLINSIKSNISR